MPINRRTFMKLAAAGLTSALGPLASCVKSLGYPVGTTHFPTPDQPLTPTFAWYQMSIQGAYEADRANYRLKVAGLVHRELTLTDASLRGNFQAAKELITLSCVGNPPGGNLLSSSLFRGVRLKDLMAEANVSDDASGAVIVGLDGFVAFQSIEDLKRPESMIAYDMGISDEDLAPLPIEHGFPARILTPGLYGYMQPKWIDSITFVDQSGQQEVLRRSIDYLEGKMQLASGFSSPRGGTLVAGQQEILGYAFGDGRSIAKIDVQVDDGPFMPAEIVWNDLHDSMPRYLWSLWRFSWNATPGTHRLTSRATYEDGETQIQGQGFPYSGGALTTIVITVEAPA